MLQKVSKNAALSCEVCSVRFPKCQHTSPDMQVTGVSADESASAQALVAEASASVVAWRLDPSAHP